MTVLSSSSIASAITSIAIFITIGEVTRDGLGERGGRVESETFMYLLSTRRNSKKLENLHNLLGLYIFKKFDLKIVTTFTKLDSEIPQHVHYFRGFLSKTFRTSEVQKFHISGPHSRFRHARPGWGPFHKKFLLEFFTPRTLTLVRLETTFDELGT